MNSPKYKEIVCCGYFLVCSKFTNTCERCGADYNWTGAKLAPRRFWGEETGESVSDILNIDAGGDFND